MKAFHEWREVKEVSEALPTFCTSDIGHFFVVGDLEKEEAANTLVYHHAAGGRITENVCPALTTQTGGQLYALVAADLGGNGRYEREEGGPYLPGMGGGEVLSEDGRDTSPRGSL